MQQLHWYKVSTHLFSNPAVRHILGYPNGDTYFVVYFYLKELACAACDGGNRSITPGVPLLMRDIARGCGRRRTVIEKSLQVFSECGLIHIDAKTGMIRLTDWDDMQSLCKDETRREQTRQRVTAYRERKKAAEHIHATTPESVAEEVDRDCAPSTVDDEERNPNTAKTCRTHVLPRPATDTSSPSVAHYQTVFGPASTVVATRLADLESIWPAETICTAIDVAKSKGRSNIKYIEKIIENGIPVWRGRNWDRIQADLQVEEVLAQLQKEEDEEIRRRHLVKKQEGRAHAD